MLPYGGFMRVAQFHLSRNISGVEMNRREKQNRGKSSRKDSPAPHHSDSPIGRIAGGS